MNKLNSSPLVSVIIPAYNSGQYLRRALDSIRNQTYGNLEVCLTNDGSTDCTEEVVEHFRKENPSFSLTYITRDHRGVSAARNAAVAESQGKYLVLLDADDSLKPQCVERLVAYKRRYPTADIIAGGSECLEFDGRGQLIARGLFKIDRIQYLPSREAFKRLFSQNLLGIISILITRGLFDRAGGFDENYRNSEDLAFWFQAARSGDILLIPEILGVLHKYPAGRSREPGLLYRWMRRAYRDNKPHLLREYPREGRAIYHRARAFSHLAAVALYRSSGRVAIGPILYHLFCLLLKEPRLIFSRRLRKEVQAGRSFYIPVKL